MRRHSLAIDCGIVALLIAVNLLVILPFFQMDFSSQAWNNDYTYIGMTRMFRDRPWTWNSLQYGGAPFRYLYPPLFHLLAMAMPVASLGRAYHIVSGLAYALMAAAFYIAALQLFRWRWLAAALALIESFSPTALYDLLPGLSGFAGAYRHGPWNFVALVAANESAHTLSLALVLLVLALAWRDRWIAAALCAAAVFLMNWAGIIGLLMVLAALGVARARDLGLWQAGMRVASVAGIGYGLAAFWASPDCILTTKLLNRVVLRHIQLATPWSWISGMVLASSALVVAAAFWRRIPTAAAFAMALLAISGAVVVSYSLTGNYLLPLPHRYILEFNVGLVLAIGCVATAAWRWRRAVGVAVLVASALPAVRFLPGAWGVQQQSQDPRTTRAFQISEWLAAHAGSARVVTAGELEGSLNIWADTRQIGGSAQGVSNYLVPAAQREITLGCADTKAPTRMAELWMRAIGARYLVVHGPASSEHFHWMVQPERFAAWPVAWTNGAGDTIYQLPGQEEPEVVVVDLARMRQLGEIRSTGDARFLEAYVAWAAGKRAAQIGWRGPDHAEVRADLSAGEAILVKGNYDAGWSASAGVTASDPIGFLLIQGPVARAVTLRFGASWSEWVGRGVTLITLLLLVFRAPMWATALAALAPSIAVYGILSMQTPRTAVVAEQAYARLQPPLIGPAAIVDGVTMKPPPFARGSVISVFGNGFGSLKDSVRVWVGERDAEIMYHGPNQLNLRLPADAAATENVSVEVNGCRGNSFAVAITGVAQPSK